MVMHKHHYWAPANDDLTNIPTLAVFDQDTKIYVDRLDHRTDAEAIACAMAELYRSFEVGVNTN